MLFLQHQRHMRGKRARAGFLAIADRLKDHGDAVYETVALKCGARRVPTLDTNHLC